MLKLASIQQINEGLVVMKHFFELNRKLLPLYFNLNIKKEKSVRDYLDIDKINSVNDSYNFDVKASKVLLNSDILDYIQNAFFVIQNEGSDLNEKKAALNIFMSEYNYLKKNWENVDAN
jgi:hypothetical protein